MHKFQHSLCFFPFVSSLLVTSGCLRKPSSEIKSLNPDYQLSFEILSFETDPAQGNRLEAEVVIRPSLGKDWKVEFDYPHTIEQIKMARLISGDNKGQYLVAEGTPIERTETNAPVMKDTTVMTATGDVSYKVDESWPGGFKASISIPKAKDWILEFDYEYEISHIWNAKIISHEGKHYKLGYVYDAKEIGFTSYSGNGLKQPSNIRFSAGSATFLRSDVSSSETERPALTNNTDGDATRFIIVAYGAKIDKNPPKNPIFYSTKSRPRQDQQQSPQQVDQRTPPGANCVLQDWGISKRPVAGPKNSYPQRGQLSEIPALTKMASNSEMKKFVADVYDKFPVFKEIYEDGLQLTRTQALAFHYGDMSIESASDVQVNGKAILMWRIDYETATENLPNPANAWGPFQAAVTNFTNGGFDKDILNSTGLPTPDIKDFRNAPISTFVGMKRLAEGIIESSRKFGPNHAQGAVIYLLGTLAHHNTGHTNAALEKPWLDFYGNNVLRLMNAYYVGDNMSNNKVFYTGQPIEQICR